ncbi:MAG: DUF4249 domain-containing protein [Bacteroidetes bacterium]|nr:DUF4249 domain-containing protein [Bacteroidota bacterium]
MKNLLLAFLMLFYMVSCMDVYDEPLPAYEPELVIEAYVNQVNVLGNYALLTKSLAYYDESFEVEGVTGANVRLFEGQKLGNTLEWQEEGIQFEPLSDEVPGLYAPPLTGLFLAKEGYYYKLVVEYQGVTATSIAHMPAVVPIDTFYAENIFNNNTDSVEPYLRMRFADPPAFGNYYLISEYRNDPGEFPLLWGSAERLLVNDDALFNGNDFTFSSIFPDKYGDTINFYLMSIDRPAYDFWLSYDASRNNGGPFSQPVNLSSNFDNARGIFQAMAVSHKRIIVTKP